MKSRHPYHLATTILFALYLFPLVTCHAQTFTWTGLGVDDNWLTGLNWNGSNVPTPGNTTQIIFANPAVRSNPFQNIATPFQLNELEFVVTNGSFNSAGQSLEFVGSNPLVRLTNGSFSSSGIATANQDWILSANTRINQTAASTSLIHNGAISGTGSLTNQAFVTLNGTFSSSGALLVNDRTTTFNGTMGAGTDVVVNGGSATLTGTGTINRNVVLQGLGGGRLRSASTLTINGNLSAPSGIIEAGSIAVNGITSMSSVFSFNGLTISAGASLVGTGTISVTSTVSQAQVLDFSGTLSEFGSTGANQTLELNGQAATSSSTGAQLRGSQLGALPGLIQGTSNLRGGTVTNSLRFGGVVNLLTGSALQFGTRNTGQGFGDSRISIDQTVNVEAGSNATFRSEFLGAGSLNIGTGASTTFSTAIVGPALMTNINGGTLISINGGRFDGAVNLNSGTFNAIDGNSQNFTATSSLNAESGTSSLSMHPSSSMNLDGQLVVKTGAILNVSGKVSSSSGLGQLVVEDGGILNASSAVINLNSIVRGSVTNFDQQVGRTLTLEGGSVAGVSNQAGTLIVQTSEQSRILAGSDFLVNGSPTNILEGSLLIENTALVRGANGVFVSDGANLTVNGELRKATTVVEGGTLQGSGQMEGTLNVAGMLSPGNSAGTLKVKGQIDLTGTATVCIEIGGTTPGTGFDVLDGRMTSNLNLGNSRLEVMLINGFVPDPSHQFVFLQNFNSISGVFGNAGDGFQDGQRIHFSGGSFGISYGSNSIFLNDFQAVPEPSSICLALISGLLVSSPRKRRNTP